MPADYNAVGGQGYNQHDPRKDPREATFDGRPALQTGGSSSGIGTAANFWAGNVGSETSDRSSARRTRTCSRRSSRRSDASAATASFRSPPIRTRGADGEERRRRRDHVRRDGKRVTRPNDPATRTCTPAPGRDYTTFLKKDGLKGAHRHPAASFYDAFTPPAATRRPRQRGRRRSDGDRSRPWPRASRRRRWRPDRGTEEGDGRRDRRPQVAGRDHRRSGEHSERDGPGSQEQFPALDQCSGVTNAKGKDEDCSVVLSTA